MKNLFTHVLGCKVNYADVQSIVERLDLPADESAALVGTCCVTAEGEKQSRKEVRRAARRVGPGGRVYVTGCASRLQPDIFSGLAENVIVVNGEPDEVLAQISGGMAPGAAKHDGAADAGSSEHLERTRQHLERTRFYLKIQDGCANRCSYCVIPRVRGNPRSIPAAEVMDSAASMIAVGYPELVVSGINLGAWRDGELRLPQLLDRLAALEGLTRLRLSSLEVNAVTTELLEVMSAHECIGRHLHLPLQSGDDRVLKRMGRRYDTAAFSAAARKARAAVSGINLTTDVMVGFPAETGEAFLNTVSFIEAGGFSRLHVFAYSPRPGTAAAEMGDPVPAAEKQRRSRILRELSERLQQAHRRRKVGLTSEILLESPLPGGLHTGYSSDYTKFIVAGGGRGSLVSVNGREVVEAGVRGEAAAFE